VEPIQEAPIADSPRIAAPGFIALVLFAAAVVVDGVLESLVWPDQLWGSHFYAFFPPAALIFSASGALLAIGFAALGRGAWIARPVATSRRQQVAAAAGAALLAGLLFWTLRERHLFWGDALPLSIDLPRGQAFHPDEPLTMFLHQLLYRLGNGHWSGANAVALGSTLAGTLFVALSALWFLTRSLDPWVCGLATAALAAQGFTALFFGHVENYSYLAVALLVFFVSGVDFLEERAGPYVPIAAAVVAYALHILGGLTVVPAAVLIGYGLANPRQRIPTAVTAVVAIMVVWVASTAFAGLYPANRAPLDGLTSGASRVFGNTKDMRSSVIFSSRHWANLWSQLNLVGPLSIPWLGLVSAVLGTRSRTGHFFYIGIAALLGPCLITGEGNLGAARNWDLFAAPALVPPLAGLTLLIDRLDLGQARRLMLALLAASLFHTVPWILLNTDVKGTMDRVARLPLTGGRGEVMIGTHYLNLGRLDLAEHWFRLAVARNFDNANGQSGLGLALARQGKLGEAVGPMILATRLRPGVVSYQDDLIALFVSLQRWEEAAAVLQDWLMVEPMNADAWQLLSNCKARGGDPDGAVDVLEEGCRRMPSEPQLAIALGNAYEWSVVQHGLRREWPAARAQFDRFAATFPDDPRLPRLREGIP
jgi:hypothetical protein